MRSISRLCLTHGIQMSNCWTEISPFVGKEFSSMLRKDILLSAFVFPRLT